MSELEKALGSVASQLMNGQEVVLDDQRLRVKRVGSGRLRMVQFRWDGRTFEAIEQNPEKPSQWGKLAREKHQVVQFRDVEAHKYIAVAVDGVVREYASDSCRIAGCRAPARNRVRPGSLMRTKNQFKTTE